jgi:hypothetical protein
MFSNVSRETSVENLGSNTKRPKYWWILTFPRMMTTIQSLGTMFLPLIFGHCGTALETADRRLKAPARRSQSRPKSGERKGT